MPRLEHKPHEAFCQAIAKGKTGVQAYRECVAEPGSKTDSCMEGACRLLSDVKITSRIEQLQKQYEQIAERQLHFGKEKLIRLLVEVIETPVGELDQNHRLANEVTRDEIMGSKPDDPITVQRVKIKGISKADAIKQLAQICGWNAATKMEVAADNTLAAALAGIRKDKPE